MTINLKIKGDRSDADVREVINSAVHAQISVAKYRYEQFEKACLKFEEKYGMTSDLFLQKFEAGELGDDTDFFDWFAMKRGCDKWLKKYELLLGISV